MAELNYQVDANNAQEMQYEKIPSGDYLVVIDDSDYGPNSQKTGQVLKLFEQIIDGPMKGKKLLEALNLENESQQSEQIAQRTLNAIALACGFPDKEKIKDSSQLHGIPFWVKVTTTKDEQYPNKIQKHWAAKNESQPNSGQPVPGGQSTTTDQSTTDPASAPNGQPQKKQPWEK